MPAGHGHAAGVQGLSPTGSEDPVVSKRIVMRDRAPTPAAHIVKVQTSAQHESDAALHNNDSATCSSVYGRSFNST